MKIIHNYPFYKAVFLKEPLTESERNHVIRNILKIAIKLEKYNGELSFNKLEILNDSDLVIIEQDFMTLHALRFFSTLNNELNQPFNENYV